VRHIKITTERNITSKDVHIDHIIPVKAFVENGIFDLDIINDDKNLQLLSSRENLSKSGKYNQEDLVIFLKERVSV